jgi:carbonic anhydrase
VAVGPRLAQPWGLRPNLGGDLAYIGYLSTVVSPGGPRFEVAVIHHTDCGTHFLADAD